MYRSYKISLYEWMSNSHRQNGVVVKASASHSLDLGLFCQSSHRGDVEELSQEKS